MFIVLMYIHSEVETNISLVRQIEKHYVKYLGFHLVISGGLNVTCNILQLNVT